MGSEDRVFNLLLEQKDIDSSDLNKRFESYKCHTLEAKIPVVEAGTSARLQGSSENVQLLNTLRMKARGVVSTRNSRLKMTTINNNIVIEATPQDEREEVSKPELDAEIEEYMVERRRKKAIRELAKLERAGVVVCSTVNEVIKGLEDSDDDDITPNASDIPSTSKLAPKLLNGRNTKKGSNNNQNKDPGNLSQMDLDAELDEYMRQNKKKKSIDCNMDVD